MALPDQFLDEVRARTPLAALVGRRVRLTKSGRNWKGCCPFHNEKTPSFYVYEDGYHCFGCGAHGNAIGFVMQTQGSGFIEAVTALAGEAGLEMPRLGPDQMAAQARSDGVQEVLGRAEAEFRRLLGAPAGRRALDYLTGRGLTGQTIERFGLGWSGEGRGSLVSVLRAAGADDALLAETGLVQPDGRELFFNRVMFPIRDRGGRIISFGGRILGDGVPKYVNGPETALFSKRRSLYGLDLARAAVRGGAELVVAEGYMDVIALHQAGFAGAVAPLGTALTEEQMAELWRLSPVPVLCFDGDAAGARAALRAVNLALPHLTPEQSLRLASLPNGQDPDSLVRAQGPAGFAAVLAAARPVSDVLFDLLRQGQPLAGPEQRAAFRERLAEAAGRIGHKGLAAEYRRSLLERFFTETRTARPTRMVPGPRGAQTGGTRDGGARGPVRFGARPVPDEAAGRAECARILSAIALSHPALLHQLEDGWVRIALDAGLAQVRDATLAWFNDAQELDSAGLITHLTKLGLEEDVARVLSRSPHPLPACVAPDAQPVEVLAAWHHLFQMLHRDRLEADIAAARRDVAAGADGLAQERLVRLREAAAAIWREPGEEIES